MKLDYPSLEACPCVDTSLRGRHVASGSGGSVGAEASMGRGFPGAHGCCLCDRCRLELGG